MPYGYIPHSHQNGSYAEMYRVAAAAATAVVSLNHNYARNPQNGNLGQRCHESHSVRVTNRKGQPAPIQQQQHQKKNSPKTGKKPHQYRLNMTATTQQHNGTTAFVNSDITTSETPSSNCCLRHHHYLESATAATSTERKELTGSTAVEHNNSNNVSYHSRDKRKRQILDNIREIRRQRQLQRGTEVPNGRHLDSDGIRNHGKDYNGTTSRKRSQRRQNQTRLVDSSIVTKSDATDSKNLKSRNHTGRNVRDSQNGTQMQTSTHGSSRRRNSTNMRMHSSLVKTPRKRPNTAVSSRIKSKDLNKAFMKKHVTSPMQMQPEDNLEPLDMKDADPNNYRISGGSFDFMQKKKPDTTEQMFQQWIRDGSILPCPIEIEDKVSAWFAQHSAKKSRKAPSIPAVEDTVPVPTSLINPRRNPELIMATVSQTNSSSSRNSSSSPRRSRRVQRCRSNLVQTPSSSCFSSTTTEDEELYNILLKIPDHANAQAFELMDERSFPPKRQQTLRPSPRTSKSCQSQRHSASRKDAPPSTNQQQITLVQKEIPDDFLPREADPSEEDLNRLPADFDQSDMSYENLLQLDAFITRSGRGLNGDSFRKQVQWIKLTSPEKFTCPICLDKLTSTQNIALLRHCKHIFCMSCIRTHFERSKLCPCCRFDCSLGD